MDAEQKTDFYRLIDEWHFLYNGERARIGYHDA
jgi:hypothetical protein